MDSTGIREVLSKLQNDEILGLASTVTQGLLRNKTNTREEALEVILKYSTDFLSILRRKVITREILFSYLHDNNVPVQLPVSTTKNDLIDLVLKHWNQPAPHLIPAGHAETVVQSEGDVNTLALKFSEWFYALINRGAPMGCEHFWDDASLKLKLIAGTDVITKCIVNISEIVQTLYNTQKTHNLFFNPNCTSHGVQGRMESHGLVLVLSCGTLHTNNICVGIFETVFMLARDPFAENNWKIKKLELSLHSKNEVTSLPRLDSSLQTEMLALPNS